jgi:hypothetical protein
VHQFRPKGLVGTSNVSGLRQFRYCSDPRLRLVQGRCGLIAPWARSRPIPHASKPVHHLVSQLRTFGSTPLPVPLSGRVLRMAKAAVDLSPFTWRHLFRLAERLIVVGIRSMPRPSLGRRPLPHIACSAFRAMNSNALVGLVLKNPEIHAQPPLSSPCQNDANRNKSDRPHATAKSSDTVMASS